VKTGFATDNNC